MLFEKIKLEKSETLIMIVRKHWFIHFVQFFATALAAIAPLVILYVFTRFATATEAGVAASAPAIDFIRTYSTEISFLYLAWLLINWMIIFSIWTDFYLDLWAVTTRRVISIDQRGFFRRFISSFRLERLQDMNIEIHGIIPTLLNFGTVEAQTAGGSNEEFKTNGLPDPRGLKAAIIRAADERQKIVNRENKSPSSDGVS